MTALTVEAASFPSLSGLARAQSGPRFDVAGPVEVRVERAVNGTDHGVLSRAGAFRCQINEAVPSGEMI